MPVVSVTPSGGTADSEDIFLYLSLIKGRWPRRKVTATYVITYFDVFFFFRKDQRENVPTAKILTISPLSYWAIWRQMQRCRTSERSDPEKEVG